MNRTLKNVSKAFALVLALVMVLGVAIPAFAAPVTDGVLVDGEKATVDGNDDTLYTVELSKGHVLDTLTEDALTVNAGTGETVVKTGYNVVDRDGEKVGVFTFTIKTGEVEKDYTVEATVEVVENDEPEVLAIKNAPVVAGKDSAKDDEDDTLYTVKLGKVDLGKLNAEDVKVEADDSTAEIKNKVFKAESPNKATVTFDVVKNAGETDEVKTSYKIVVTSDFPVTGSALENKFTVKFLNKNGLALTSEAEVRALAHDIFVNEITKDGKKVNPVTYTFNDKGEIEFNFEAKDDNKGSKVEVELYLKDAEKPFATKTLFEVAGDDEIKIESVVPVEGNENFEFKINRSNEVSGAAIQTKFDNKNLEGIQFVVEEVNRDGKVVANLGVTEPTNADGLVNYGQYIDIKEGRTNAESASLKKPFDNGKVVVEIGGQEHTIANGNGVKFTPIKNTIKDADAAKRYDDKLNLTFYPWTANVELDSEYHSKGYVARDVIKTLANPFVIDFGITEYTLNIKAYTKADNEDAKPVANSEFAVYELNDDNTLGKKVKTVKTNADGLASTKLPKAGSRVYYTDGNLAKHDIPYILVQENAGSDSSVTPFEGRIYLTGKYTDRELNALTGSDLVNRQLRDDVLTVTVRNLKGAVASFEGKDIYENSVEVAKAAYPELVKDKYEGYKNIVIATAEEGKLADALAASSVAALYDAPLLVVGEDTLPESVEEYVKNSGATRAIIVGGPNTIDNKIVSALEAYTGSIKRFAGENRFETAVEIAKDVLDKTKENKVFLANGQASEKFADALTVSSAAGQKGYPVLLTDSDKLVDATERFFENNNISKVFVIGGENTIAETVAADVSKASNIATTYERIAGDTRYATSVAIAKRFFPEATKAVFVNGEANALALIAGPYAETLNAPVLLVGNDVPASVKTYLEGSKIQSGLVVGGEESVSKEVRAEIAKLVK